MSESTSCSERARAALEAVVRGERLSRDLVRALGEECPAEFFRVVIESLADSFDPVQSDAYDELMGAWDLRRLETTTVVPDRVECVSVLSRVTLGADIKITSMILDAMKRRFPEARIVFVGGRKSIELFEGDGRLEFVEVDYPRSGPVSLRTEFAGTLRGGFDGTSGIVVDPDSRITQLGLISLGEPGRYFHFPSRTAGGTSLRNLSELTSEWLQRTFGVSCKAYVAPRPVPVLSQRPAAAVSLGVGENESKRVPGEFESQLIRLLGQRFRTIHVDRGAGGEESRRVGAAVAASGMSDRVRFHEGSFAGFVSIIAQSDFYAGYDSAGQHAAAAAGIPLISIFNGAPSRVFRARWEPWGPGRKQVLHSDEMQHTELVSLISTLLPPLHFGAEQE